MRRQSPHHEALGAALRELRLAHGTSQEQLALLSGLDRSYVGAIERGEANPSYGKLIRVAETLDLALSEWISRAEALNASSSGPPIAERP